MPSKKSAELRVTPRIREKYELYEEAVQSPEFHADWFVSAYKDLRGKYPVLLREDFCGTFRISAEWVKRNRKNRAICLDLDPEPLAYGAEKNFRDMTPGQLKRIRVLKQNVISVTRPAADLVIACNFSYCIFRTRAELVRYFRAVRKSLKPDGVFMIDLAGGPGMIEKMRERKTLRQKGKRLGTYVWDQQSFDPIHREGHYAIHFRLADGRVLNDLFRYQWRLWTIPELRDIMADAGFEETFVYWESEHEGKGTGEYIRTETGTNDYSWIAYVAGQPVASRKAKLKGR
jgi:SAM-dependent methyltransferase